MKMTATVRVVSLSNSRQEREEKYVAHDQPLGTQNAPPHAQYSYGRTAFTDTMGI